MEDFNFNRDIKFTYEFDKESIHFLDLKHVSSNGIITISLYSKPTIASNTCTADQVIRNILNNT